jgi:mannose-6-phosphate isomerase-like protein (cupin superfamily)
MVTDRGLDLRQTYLHFTEGHDIERLEVGPQFWADLMSEKLRLTGRMVGCVRLSEGPLDHWERHPKGDEFLMLLSGRCTIVLDETAGRREVTLQAGEAFVVPKGVWHTFWTQEAGDLLFATAGDGTDHRPVS